MVLKYNKKFFIRFVKKKEKFFHNKNFCLSKKKLISLNISSKRYIVFTLMNLNDFKKKNLFIEMVSTNTIQKFCKNKILLICLE